MSGPADLSASPEFYPLRWDGEAGAVQLLRLSSADYVAAGFLDERLLREGRPTTLAPWSDLEAAAARLGAESDFIFHIGHAGSTLLARVLAADPRIFAVREPAILRALARGESLDRLEVMLKLYARVWRPGQRSLVKATSFVADIGPEILALSPSARAVLMFVAPHVFIAAVLAGDASRAELPDVTPKRIARLSRRVGGAALPEVASQGEMAAAGWACEIAALAAIAEGFAGRILWLDFDRLLADLPAGLGAIVRHLRGSEGGGDIAAMLASRDLGRYAKATEHAFDASVRDAILIRAFAERRVEVDRGLAWLDVAGAAHPVLARASRAAAAGRTL